MLDRRAPCVVFPSRDGLAGLCPAEPECRKAWTPPHGFHISRDGVAGLCPAEPERGKAWKPSQGFHISRDGVAGLCPAEPERGKAWKPSQGFHIRSLPVDRLRLAVLASTLLFWAVPAQAVTVAIVRPLNPSPEMTETLVRLHGELLSVGLEVEIADGPAARGLGTTDSRAWLKELAAERGVDAVIDIAGDGGLVAVEVWVTDKAPRRFEVSRVALEANTENASERLAIRALEVLRSSFLEIDLAARERRGEDIAKPPDDMLTKGEVGKPASRH